MNVDDMKLEIPAKLDIKLPKSDENYEYPSLNDIKFDSLPEDTKDETIPTGAAQS